MIIFDPAQGRLIVETGMSADHYRMMLEQTLNALQSLYDEQNGPPIRREQTWQEAMEEAESILSQAGRKEK